MAADIVPELNAMIEASFDGYVMRDRQLNQISNRIRDGTATLRDAHSYAERLGEDLSRALVNSLTPDTLPNGTLYYNIAQRTIIPGLQNNYNLVNDAAEIIQKSVDQKTGIGLGIVRADFPIERINGLIDKITQEASPVEMVIRWLQEPIVNNSEAFADDFMRSNASFRSKAGLKATITRIADPKCCDWCAALEGTYEYGKEPKEVYARHEYCRCTVTYQSEKTSQNVWTKRTWQSTPEELASRRDAGETKSISAEERLTQIDQILESLVQTRSPEQIEAEVKRIQRQRRISARR